MTTKHRQSQPPEPSMQFDVRGCIRAMRVPLRSAFNPVFEAVINSIHATQDRFGDAVAELGQVTVEVHRKPELWTHGLGKEPVGDVCGFTITDNGCGFTDANMESFRTAYSSAKARLGGKGFGRFSWLVVCREARVDSIYRDHNDQWFRRAFAFRPTDDGIECLVQRAVDGVDDCLTVVHLDGIHERYVDALRKSSDFLAERLFEQCFGYLVLGRCPNVRIVESHGESVLSFDLKDRLVELEIEPAIDLRVGDQLVQVRHVEQPCRTGRSHAVHLCANERVVTSFPLSQASGLGSKPLPGPQGALCFHHVFVSGAVLDERVDPSRSRIELDDDEGEVARADSFNTKALRLALSQHVNELLGARLQAVRDENFQQIKKHILTVQPEYKALLVHRSEKLKRLEYPDDPKRFDEVLYREQQVWEVEIRQRQAEVADKLNDEKADIQGVAEELSQVIEQVNEAGKSNLVRYVAKRHSVLGFLKTLLSKKALEAHVHRIVFPMRRTSDDVAYEDHNLWLLDDTLAFYEFVASDVRLVKMPNVNIDSEQHPDILAFKTGEPPYHHIALVEFKRPERKDENPVQQLVEYAVVLRDGGARAADGTLLPGIPRSTRIDGFAVVSLTPQLERKLRVGPGTMQRVEGEWRWYGVWPQENLTIELLDYEAFVTRAEQRNRAFFNKLGLR